MLPARTNPKRRAARLRDPECTRQRLLQVAFRDVYVSGFQTASLKAILATGGVSKGTLYYYFKSKEASGYAIVEEIIAPDLRTKWLRPLQSSKKPIDTLIGIVQGESVQLEAVRGGCPLSDLAQKMSPLEEGLRNRLAIVFREWQEGIAAALRERQAHGRVRGDTEPDETAGFLIAMLEGLRLVSKKRPGCELLKVGLRNIEEWSRSLRAGPRAQRDRTLRRRDGSCL